ncbi:hypothetical protein ACFE04_025536 [Oxalis oulophora]
MYHNDEIDPVYNDDNDHSSSDGEASICHSDGPSIDEEDDLDEDLEHLKSSIDLNEEDDFDDVQFGSDDEQFSSDEEDEDFVAETPPRGHRELQDNEESQHLKIDRGSVEMGSSRGSTTLGKRKNIGVAKCIYESKAHQENRMLEVIRDDIGNFVNDPGVKFRSFMGKSARQIISHTLNRTWHDVTESERARLWEYLLQYYVLYGSDYKYVMRHVGSLLRGWKGRIKKEWFTKRLKSDKIFDVPKEKYANITQNDWSKFVRQCASEDGVKFSNAQRERGLKNDCRALNGRRSIPDYRYKLEQQGEVNITRQDLYLRVRRDTNGKLKKSNEDILQRALGKAAPSGRAATGGINATYRTFLGKDRKKKRAEVNEFDKLKYEFDNLHKLLEKAEAQGFKVGRENYQPEQELESASKKKKVKPSKKRIDRQSISHESEYRPDLTNIEQGTPNFQDANQTLKQMGDDMFDALLRQEGTSPARVVLSAPFVDAIVDSTRLDSKSINCFASSSHGIQA